jgi:hypothetical protein
MTFLLLGRLVDAGYSVTTNVMHDVEFAVVKDEIDEAA